MSKDNKEKKQKREEEFQILETPTAKLEVTKGKMSLDKRVKIIVCLIIFCFTILTFFYENKMSKLKQQNESEIEEIKEQKENEIEEIKEQKKKIEEELEKSLKRVRALESLFDSQAGFEEIVLTKIGEEENAAYMVIDSLPNNTRMSEKDARTAGTVFYFIEDRAYIQDKVYVRFDFDSQLENWSVKIFTSYGTPVKLVPYGKEIDNMYWFEPEFKSLESNYLVEVRDTDTEDYYYFYICV